MVAVKRALLVLGCVVAASIVVRAAALSAISDWPTYQHDAGRSGFDANQGAVTSISPAWTSALDGPVYAQPLVVGTTVYAATENNSVYALDSTHGGTPLWHQRLAAPVTLSQLPCGNIDPYGITGTPVVDTVNNVLYVVALQATPSIHHELYALNTAAGGSVIYHFAIDAPNTDPKIHGQRGALTLANNRIYVVYSGRAGDCGSYVGRVVAVTAGDATGASLVSYALPNTQRGGIWTAPAADASGQLYIASGNSNASGSTPDRGESVVKLSPTLQELDFFTAPEWSSLNASDADIGSIGPMLLQNGWILQSGKNGMGYLINSASMGHLGGQLFEGQLCPSGEQAIGFGAYLAPTTVFIPCTNSLRAVHVNTSGTPSFTVTTVRAGYSGGQASSPPILVGGVLWNLDRGAALLLGFNPTTQQQLFSAPLAQRPNPFAAPAAGAGQVFVPAGSAVSAFVFNGGAGVPTPSTSTPTATPMQVATTPPTATPTQVATIPPTTPPTAIPTTPPTTPPTATPAHGGGGGGGGGGGRPGGGGTTVNINPAGGGGGGGGAPPHAAPSPPPPASPTPSPAPPTPTPTVTPVATEPPTAVPETQVQTAAVAAAAPVTAIIDPAVGGVLTTTDQVLRVEVPPDAASDLLSLSLLSVDPSGAANIAINGQQLYALSVVDSDGNPITTFLQPVTLLWAPPPTTDPSAVSIATLDPTTGTLQPLALEVTDDGRVQASVTSLAAPAVLQQPTPPQADAAPPTEVEPPAPDSAPANAEQPPDPAPPDGT
jgi:outer membrane protein assembly factor BamB